MEPITTSAMIGGIVAYLAKEKSVKEFFSTFTDETIKWIKPLFLKEDGSEKEAIQKLKEKPDSTGRQGIVKSLLEIEVEDNPKAEGFIKEIFEKMSTTKEGGKIVNIINSKNVNTGNVNTGGGDFRLGDG